MLSTEYKKSLVETVLDTFMGITRKPTGRHADVEIECSIGRVEMRLAKLMELQTRLVRIQNQYDSESSIDITLTYSELTNIISGLDLTTDLAHIVYRGMQELQDDREAKENLWLDAVYNSQK